MTDREMIDTLRRHGRTGLPGKGGFECVVDKSFLNMVADRLEELAFTPTDDDYEPIFRFFKD